VHCMFLEIFYVFIFFYLIRSTERCTGEVTNVIMRMLTHASFCVQNFVLTACRPNFATVASTSSRATRGMFGRFPAIHVVSVAFVAAVLSYFSRFYLFF